MHNRGDTDKNSFSFHSEKEENKSDRKADDKLK